MSIRPDNPLPALSRIKSLVIDWLVISAYLVVLFLVFAGVYQVIFGTITPQINELTSQIIAALTSVVPAVLVFAWLDLGRGTPGKRTSNLHVIYTHKTYLASLVRNAVKFLPWQLGHIGTIHLVYQGYDTLTMVFHWTAILLAVGLLLMGFLRRDRRHLGDRLAGTQVQLRA